MNPTLIIGYVMSLVGMSSSIVSQGVNLHRELHPPAQYAQSPQNCTPPYQPTVIIDNGVRRVVCAEPALP